MRVLWDQPWKLLICLPAAVLCLTCTRAAKQSSSKPPTCEHPDLCPLHGTNPQTTTSVPTAIFAMVRSTGVCWIRLHVSLSDD